MNQPTQAFLIQLRDLYRAHGVDFAADLNGVPFTSTMAWEDLPDESLILAAAGAMDDELIEAQAEVERLQAENEKLRNERDALRKIILDADAEWWDKKIHLVDSDESYQNWRLEIYLPVPCNVTDKEIESALDRAVANTSKL